MAAATVDGCTARSSPATAAIAVLGAALPVVAGRLTPTGATVGVPHYWQQAADWLDDEQGTALLLPGSTFGPVRLGRAERRAVAGPRHTAAGRSATPFR